MASRLVAGVVLAALALVIMTTLQKTLDLGLHGLERIAVLVAWLKGLPGWNLLAALDVVLVLFVALLSASAALLQAALGGFVRLVRWLFEAFVGDELPPFPRGPSGVSVPGAVLSIVVLFVLSGVAIRNDALF